MLLASEGGRWVDQMLRYSAAGTPSDVARYLGDFVRHADADELMVVHQSPVVEDRLRSVALLGEVIEVAAGRTDPAGTAVVGTSEGHYDSTTAAPIER